MYCAWMTDHPSSTSSFATNPALGARFMSASGLDRIAPEVRQSFPDGCFNSLATPFYLAHEHSALHRGDAKVSHAVGIGLLENLSLCFLSQEEGSEFVF